MPKPFVIGVKIEEAMFGSVVRRLNAMEGVIDLDLDLDKDRGSKPKTNGARGPYKKRGSFEESGEAVLLKLLAKSPLKPKQAREAFEALGRSGKSINSIVHKLKTAKLITSGKDGYALTAKAKAAAQGK